MGKDGSLYLGPYNPEAREVKTGRVEAKADGSLFLPYDDGGEYKEVANPGKASFHTSGIIHYAAQRAVTSAFEPGSINREICHVLFTLPDEARAKPQAEIRKTDVILPWDLSSSRPVFCSVFYSADNKHPLIDRGTELKAIFQYPQLDRVGSAFLELCFQVAPQDGPWPPEEYLIFPGTPAERPEKAPEQ